MNRTEHLQWCKARANEYLDKGDTKGAFASFNSDMSKHEGTKDHLALQLGMSLLLSGNLSTVVQMRNWINGFN
jgi:hypothetical protein